MEKHEYGETRDDLKFINLVKPLLFTRHENFFEADEQGFLDQLSGRLIAP